MFRSDSKRLLLLFYLLAKSTMHRMSWIEHNAQIVVKNYLIAVILFSKLIVFKKSMVRYDSFYLSLMHVNQYIFQRINVNKACWNMTDFNNSF